MKQTKADKDFALRFAEALGPHIEGEKLKGRSIAATARRLGVSGPGLLKQLNGGTPSVRTVALAYAEFGVSVAYEGVDVGKALSRRRGRRPKPSDANQLLLPFEITAPPSSQRLVLKLLPKSARKYHLQLMVKMSA